jgi:hypothetical protein
VASRVYDSLPVEWLQRGGARPARTLQTWMARCIGVRRRLEKGCTSSLLFLLVVTTQHALAEAARCSRLHPSPGAKMWKAPSQVAVATLASRSKPQAQPVAHARHKRPELPWHRAMSVASTLPHRARLPPANAKTFKHGQGCVVGHPWPHSVGLRHARLMPLRPIPF